MRINYFRGVLILNWKGWIWAIPVLALLFFVGWRFQQKAGSEAELESQQQGKQKRASVVELASARSASIILSLNAVGTLESPHRVEIAPRTTGRIEYLEVREGDRVQAGQVLVRIDPSDLQAALLAQKANLAQARSRLAEAKLGSEAKTVGVQSELLQQQASLGSAQADLQQVLKSYDAQVATAQAAVDNAEATVKREQASLNNTKTKLNRVQSLYQKGYIAAQDVDDAKTEVEVQEGEVKVAQSQLTSAQSQLQVTVQKSRAEITAARAKTEQAKASVNVANANRSQTPAYQENISALRSAVEAAEAQVRQVQAQLAFTMLRSPIAGTVTTRSADPGSLASPGTPALVVQSLDWLYFNCSFPLEEIEKVHEGQQVTLRFDALPGRMFLGKVTQINPAADLQSRRFKVLVKIDNANQALKPGMYGQANVETRRIQAKVVIPHEAVKTDESGGTTVMVVDEKSVAHEREVKLGASGPVGIEVVSGLDPGDRVVNLTYRPVKDGAKVRVAGQGDKGAGKSERGGKP